METLTAPQIKNDISFLWLEITEKCNLTCSHCYADSSPKADLLGKMSFQDWVVLMQDAFSNGCKQIQFIGGEPTLHPNFEELVIKAKEIGFEFIEVYTNGTLLNEKSFEMFKENQISLAFSVYADNEEIHDKITNRKGSFNKTIKSIKLAIEMHLNFRIGIVEMEINSNIIPSTFTFLKELGATKISVDKNRGIGRGSNSPTSESEKISQLCGACWSGKLSVDMNGNVFPCVFSRFYNVGNVKDGLDNILESQKLSDFRQMLKPQKRFKTDSISEYFDQTGLEICKPNCDPSVCDPSICDPSYCDPSKCDPSYS